MDIFTLYRTSTKVVDDTQSTEIRVIGKLYVYNDGITIQSEDEYIKKYYEMLFAGGTRLILPARGKSPYEEIIPEEERIGADDFLPPQEEKEVKPGDPEYLEALGCRLPLGYALSRDGERSIHSR